MGRRFVVNLSIILVKRFSLILLYVSNDCKLMTRLCQWFGQQEQFRAALNAAAAADDDDDDYDRC